MTASRYDLLPPNATQLERDVSRAISSLERIKPGETQEVFDADVFENEVFANQRVLFNLRTAKRTTIPSSVVPWLIYEYGLGEILPYLGDNQRRALAEGVLWQRVRGTPAAVRIALGWIGVDGFIDESEGGSARWAEYQLGLAAAISGDALFEQIAAVTRISSPVRSRLQRVYAVYDCRRFILSHSLLSGGDLLSDHSGVRLDPELPQISFGSVHAGSVQFGAVASSAHTRGSSGLVGLDDLFVLSHSRLSEDSHQVNHPSLLTTLRGEGVMYQGQTWGAFTWQQQTTWLTTNVVASSAVTTETA
jgi:P2-related tail formation protein